MRGRVHTRVVVGVLLLLSGGAAWGQTAVAPAAAPKAAQAKPHNYARWEKAIEAFEAADKKNPPPKDGILFVGSSTIVRWKTLAEDFPGQPVINRGFGGNEICDSTHFADRMIFPYRPKMIFLRAGSNDIHAGKTPQQVFEDFKEFVRVVHEKLPETEILFISLAPAISRWNERDANKELNNLVEAYAKTAPHVKYIESYDISLDKNGQPRPELFVADKLHFSPEGYKLLAERVRAYMPGNRD